MILEPLHPLCVSQHYFFYLYEIFLEYFCQRNSTVLGTDIHVFRLLLLSFILDIIKCTFGYSKKILGSLSDHCNLMSPYRKKNCARSFVTSSKILLPCFGPVVKNYYSYASVFFFRGRFWGSQDREGEREFHFNQQCKIEI